MNALLDPRAMPDSRTLSMDEFAAQADRDTALADISHLAVTTGGIFLCLTVYNEPAEALLCSLAGLAKTIALLRRTHFNIVVNICVLVDGLHTCSPSMRAALERFVGADRQLLSDSHDVTCHYREVDTFDLSAYGEGEQGKSDDEVRWQQCLSESQAMFGDAQVALNNTAQLLIAVKSENRGKLDSHWWFYRVFCPRVMPTYCFQMDVGTVPTGHAFNELIEAFQRDARVGAVASGILPPRPSSAWNLLQCWQYASFANSILLEWPAESAAGYLSVIPGQLSAVRWDAIEGSHTPCHDAERRDPLDVYFDGLGQLTPQESMLYLAEDRVLCREIVSNPQTEWTICHVDNALAITDPCHSWEELLRQRKRWCNGYMACRVSYIRKLPNFLCNPAVAARRKLRAATAGLYHSIVLALDWCTPAIFLLFLFSLVQNAISLVHAVPAIQGGLELGLYTVLCALAVQFSLCYRGSLSARTIVFYRFSVALQASVLAVSFLLNLLLGETRLLALLLLFVCGAAPLGSLIRHRQLTRTILAGTPIVFSTMSIVSLLMWMYAICNAHDSSWGTKGLVSDARNAEPKHPSGQVQKSPFLRFRDFYVTIWLGSNLSLAYLVDRWFSSNRHNAVITLLAIMCTITLFGLVCRACARPNRAAKLATGNAKTSLRELGKPLNRPIHHPEPSQGGAD